ncbi:hypothetical protein ES708_19141 [subsurface metagenome]
MAKRPSMMVLRSLSMAKRPPSDEEIGLFGATVAVEGVTTGAGTAAGDNFIDAGLKGAGDNSFVSMLAVLYPGQPQNVDSKDITAFDNLTGKVTLAGAYKGVAEAIPAGVPYKIVTFRFVPAEVAAIEAKLGKMLFSMDFWSDPQEEVVMTGAKATPGLPSVTVGDLPGGATIVRAIAMFKFRMVENTNEAENSLDKTEAQPIQVQEPDLFVLHIKILGIVGIDLNTAFGTLNQNIVLSRTPKPTWVIYNSTMSRQD